MLIAPTRHIHKNERLTVLVKTTLVNNLRELKMKQLSALPIVALIPVSVFALGSSENAHGDSHYNTASDAVVAAQRANLAANTAGKGFGPQSPRDIDSLTGTNNITFETAPSFREMNLCNIHFHKNAEHKGGDFTTYAGNGDGKGYHTGYQYDGQLTPEQLRPTTAVCPDKHGGLQPGDTIELHYVHSSAQVEPGPTLGACLSESIMNPQLRVETQVYVLVNDASAADFVELTKHKKVNGVHQAINIPTDTGAPVQYAGSTTGPSYNEAGSPLQVSWSVRPKVKKVDIATVGQWCGANQFDETQAHGVRNLVTNPNLLSEIGH